MLLEFSLQGIFSVKLLPFPPVSDPEAGQAAPAPGLLLIEHSSEESIPKIAVPNAIASLLFQKQHIYVLNRRLAPKIQSSAQQQERLSSPRLGCTGNCEDDLTSSSFCAPHRTIPQHQSAMMAAESNLERGH